MGTIDLSYSGLGAGLLLMLIPFYFLWRYRTGMLGAAVLGTVRNLQAYLETDAEAYYIPY